jgi:VanZ family protein
MNRKGRSAVLKPKHIISFLVINSYTIFLIFFICFFCFLPREKALVGVDEYADVVFHILLFALLSIVAAVGFIKQNLFATLKYSPIISSVIMAGSLGVFVEIVQHFWVLNRSADIWDVVFDGIGIALGVATFYWIYGIRKRYSR